LMWVLYPNEREMLRPRRFAVICVVLAVLSLFAAQTIRVTSQPAGELQPRFTGALMLVLQVESAGASSEEVAHLLFLLNRALQLDEEASNLPEWETQRRAQLVAEIDETLRVVEVQAKELRVAASGRNLTRQMTMFASGAAAAFLAMLAYVLAAYLSWKYRVRRTFQMRIKPK